MRSQLAGNLRRSTENSIDAARTGPASAGHYTRPRRAATRGAGLDTPFPARHTTEVRAPRTSLVAASFLLALAALSQPGRARAYEDQLGLAIGAGYAVIPSSGPASPEGAPLPQHGLVLQAQVALGLGDTWELRALAGWAIEIGDVSLHRVHGGLELVYLLDILEVVPFLGLGLDVPTSILGDEVWVDFAGHAVFGVDWLPAREWSVGIEIRPYVLFTALTRTAGDPVWLTATARFQYLFEI